MPHQAYVTGRTANVDCSHHNSDDPKKNKFQTSFEYFAANEVGRVLMVEVRLSRSTFGAGHCVIFEGETLVDGIAVLVRGQATYKTVLQQDEAAAWLLRQGCPAAKAADLLEEALKRRPHRILNTEA